MVEYAIVGDMSSVLAEVARLFDRYDGRGYGTHMHWMSMETDGTYKARVSRSKSCD